MWRFSITGHIGPLVDHFEHPTSGSQFFPTIMGGSGWDVFQSYQLVDVSDAPTASLTDAPTVSPTQATASPTDAPTSSPTDAPTASPTQAPSINTNKFQEWIDNDPFSSSDDIIMVSRIVIRYILWTHQ